MIVDASALVALILEEADAADLTRRLDAQPCWTHPLSVNETVLAVARETGDPAHVADEEVRRFLRVSGIGITMLSHMEASEAVRAFERYGKGRHPAGLNMGDCFS